MYNYIPQSSENIISKLIPYGENLYDKDQVTKAMELYALEFGYWLYSMPDVTTESVKKRVKNIVYQNFIKTIKQESILKLL